jgi:hypothetical protein
MFQTVRRGFAVMLVCAAGAIFALPASAQAAGTYVTYLTCSGNPNGVQSHSCQIGEAPTAFFESPAAEVEFEICFVPPNSTEEFCSEEELAEEGELYGLEIPAELPGTYLVSWWVNGTEEIASWSLTMSEPPPPPPPVVTPTPTPQPAPAPAPAPAPVVTPPTPSAACLSAEGQVKKLQKKLSKAKSPKAKAALRKALRKARATARGAC